VPVKSKGSLPEQVEKETDGEPANLGSPEKLSLYGGSRQIGSIILSSVLWHCSLGIRKMYPTCKTIWHWQCPTPISNYPKKFSFGGTDL